MKFNNIQMTAPLMAALLAVVRAECPNACSGHGTCGGYDMCTCYANWVNSDCSGRVCPFGLAHADTPKGDLDGSTAVDETDVVIVSSDMYPYGTVEAFPLFQDAAANSLSESVHGYMECSNKGLCDRTSGACTCFTGYEGHACQRTSCPNDCNGHGVCKSIKQIADDQDSNVYELWDKDSTMGCSCDAGWYGPDCTLRKCPVGVDPLYTDDTATARLATFAFNLEGSAAAATGTYSVKFYDVFGQEWETDSIDASATSCTDLKNALLALPNTVIPDLTCEYNALTHGTSFTITFTDNPGYLKNPVINTHLDGEHDETVSVSSGTFSADVYPYKSTGEQKDYFATQCSGVQITFADESTAGALLGLQSVTVSSGTIKKLKQCLGDADGDSDNNVDIENWDYGSVQFDSTNGYYTANAHPHVVRVVDSTSSSTSGDGGELIFLFWDPVAEKLMALNRADTTLTYNVFVTDGVATQLFYDDDGDGHLEAADVSGVAYFTQYDNTLYMNRDYSCEKASYGSSSEVNVCLQNDDIILVPDASWGAYKATNFSGDGTPVSTTVADYTQFTNVFYRVRKIWTDYATSDYTSDAEDRYRITTDFNFPYSGTGQYGDPSTTSGTTYGTYRVYKFVPKSSDLSYDGSSEFSFATECSNHGLCQTDSGLCQCFTGYYGVDCSSQSALAA